MNIKIFVSFSCLHFNFTHIRSQVNLTISELSLSAAGLNVSTIDAMDQVGSQTREMDQEIAKMAHQLHICGMIFNWTCH